jgi:hypothetical protein
VNDELLVAVPQDLRQVLERSLTDV